MSDTFNEDISETPDDTGEPPHPMGPWGHMENHEDLTDSEEWLGDDDGS